MCGGSSCRCISDCNPRAPCGARRTLSRVVALLAAISIHAPAWGATVDDLPRADVLAFQSTRPRGARLTMRVTRSGSLAFQSTRPRGARHDILHGRRIQPTISIHAPAWGATSSSRRRPARPRHFNPRARVGRDGMVGRQVSTGSYFNPRAHTGRDSRPPARPRRSANFNPRAHTGRDLGRCALGDFPDLFQSTRPHGARRRNGDCQRVIYAFQSTRPHGARLRFSLGMQ